MSQVPHSTPSQQALDLARFKKRPSFEKSEDEQREFSRLPSQDSRRLAEEDALVEQLEKQPVHVARAGFMPYAAEFFGTMVFVMFGCGANCQAHLTNNSNISPDFSAGNWTSLSLGWGAGLAMAIWISGGHVNPAVTLAMAVFRGFSWRRLPGYWLSQLLGGICGAGVVYGNYMRAIDILEGGRQVRTLTTAGYFGTVPLTYVSNVECFFSEFTGAAILVMGVFALLDKSRNNWTSGIVPIGIFILFTGLATAFGAQTSFAYNPARDLGPRMLTAMVGYGGQVFTFRNWYWLYAPVIGSFTGGILGAGIYDIFLYNDRYNVVDKMLCRHKLVGGRAGKGRVQSTV